MKNTSLPLTDKPTDKPNASKIISDYMFDKGTSSLTCYLNEKPITLDFKNIVGRGGSKMIFDIGSGYVIALLNVMSNSPDLLLWNRIVSEEVTMAKKFHRAGLLCQRYEEAVVSIEGNSLKVIKTLSFKELRARGIEIRERKVLIENQARSQSLLFDTRENFLDVQHWLKLFEFIKSDIVLFYSAGLDVLDPGDSYSIAILDPPPDPSYGKNKSRLFSEKNQYLRLFFQDFSSKYEMNSKDLSYNFFDSEGNIEGGGTTQNNRC